jgi:hypothetical protein
MSHFDHNINIDRRDVSPDLTNLQAYCWKVNNLCAGTTTGSSMDGQQDVRRGYGEPYSSDTLPKDNTNTAFTNPNILYNPLRLCSSTSFPPFILITFNRPPTYFLEALHTPLPSIHSHHFNFDHSSISFNHTPNLSLNHATKSRNGSSRCPTP